MSTDDTQATEPSDDSVSPGEQAGLDEGTLDDPIFPNDFGPEEDPYLEARMNRLDDPHQDDLILWVLRHHYGLDSVEMGDFLDVHRTTVRRQMEENEDGRIHVPYQPVGLFLPGSLRYDPEDIFEVEGEEKTIVRVDMRDRHYYTDREAALNLRESAMESIADPDVHVAVRRGGELRLVDVEDVTPEEMELPFPVVAHTEDPDDVAAYLEGPETDDAEADTTEVSESHRKFGVQFHLGSWSLDLSLPF